MGRQRLVCGPLPLSMVLTPTPLPRVPTPPTRIKSERPFSGSFLIAPSLPQAPFVDCLCPGCWNREDKNTVSGGRWPAPCVCGAPRPGVGSTPHHWPLLAPHTPRCGASGTPAGDASPLSRDPYYWHLWVVVFPVLSCSVGYLFIYVVFPAAPCALKGVM